MSFGTFKTGPDQYIDARSENTYSREWYGEQDLVDLGHFGGHDFPEGIRKGVNRIIGDLLADIHDASFVSRKTLDTVQIPKDDIPPFDLDKFPRATTLPLHQLASVIHNRSGDVVRQMINLSGDEELKTQAAEIESKEDRQAPTLSGLFLSDDYLGDPQEETGIPGIYRTDTFNNVSLLNQEAVELLNLLGEGTSDVIRDYVGLIARRILDAASTEYAEIYFTVRTLRRRFDEIEVPDDAEYSTITHEGLKRVLEFNIKLPILHILASLPEETRKRLSKRIYGVDEPELSEET
ncbi:hypothetical protein ACFL3T_02890 [Patescibacteria group bacterium]